MSESRKTSNEAFESFLPYRETVQAQIMGLLRSRNLTDDEMEAILEMRHQTVSSVRRSLVKAGKVEATGDKRETRSGRRAQVWRRTI